MVFNELASDAIDLVSSIPEGITVPELEKQLDIAAQQASDYTVDPKYYELGFTDRIKQFEGKRTYAYLDDNGYATAGYGHLLEPGKQYKNEEDPEFIRKWSGKRFSDEQIDIWFEEDLQKEYSKMRRLYDKGRAGKLISSSNPKTERKGEYDYDQLPWEVRGALLDVAFNAGGGFFNSFKSMAHDLRIGDLNGAALNLMYHNGDEIRLNGRSRFSKWYMSNNGPDLHPTTKRPLYLDEVGNMYTERTQTVPLDINFNHVNPETYKGTIRWWNVPTVNPETGLYYGDSKRDRVVYADASNFNVDISQAIAKERARIGKPSYRMKGPFDTSAAAVAEAVRESDDLSSYTDNVGTQHKITWDSGIERTETRANVIVRSILEAPEIQDTYQGPAHHYGQGGQVTDMRTGEVLQNELKHEITRETY
tara:strand:+ start:1005 stop:2267 length:1263 start_codon:yes stop_codon:yes gene_type:complete